MKHAKIISGALKDPFSEEAAANVIDDQGEVNWRAAMWADPGVKSCPKCKTHYWNEAAVMECTDCGAQFGDGLPVSETSSADTSGAKP
jgi:hypothetical protein